MDGWSDLGYLDVMREVLSSLVCGWVHMHERGEKRREGPRQAASRVPLHMLA